MAPMDHTTSDSVFGTDPVTHIRLDTAPSTAHTHMTTLSIFVDSVPDEYIFKELLAHTNRVNEPLMPEQGPDLTSGVIAMDGVTLKALALLSSGAFATSRFRCRALLDLGSPQSLIYQGAFGQMVTIGAADESYVRSTAPRLWSGFGSRALLSTNGQARMSIRVYRDGTPSASLAV